MPLHHYETVELDVRLDEGFPRGSLAQTMFDSLLDKYMEQAANAIQYKLTTAFPEYLTEVRVRK